MSISSINQLFDRYGKGVLFGLCFLISIAFISFFSPSGGCSCDGAMGDQIYGTSFGRSITKREFDRHQRYISMVADPETSQFASLAINFNGITAYDAAKRMGIAVTTEEVAQYQFDMITSSGLSYTEGRKNLERNLKNRGTTMEQFHEAIKYYLTIRKFYMLGASAPVVTEGETTAFADAMYQEFYPTVVRFDTFSFRDSATVTDTDIAQEYSSKRSAYSAAENEFKAADNAYTAVLNNPDRAQDVFDRASDARKAAEAKLNRARQAGYFTSQSYDVVIAVFPCNDSSPDVAALKAKITDAELRPYYETDSFRYAYRLSDTSNAFVEKRAEILRDFTQNQVRDLMLDKARQLRNSPKLKDIESMSVAERVRTFEAEARAAGAVVVTQSGFSTNSNNIPGFGNNTTLPDRLAGTTEHNPLTDPDYSPWNSMVTVALRTNSTPPTFMTLDQAKTTITYNLRTLKQDTAAFVAAEAFSKMANTELENGKSFKTILGTRSMQELDSFTPYLALSNGFASDTDLYNTIALETFATSAGRVTKPIQLPSYGFGAPAGYAVVYVSKTGFPSLADIRTDTTYKTNFEGVKQTQNLNELAQWLELNTTRRFRYADE